MALFLESGKRFLFLTILNLVSFYAYAQSPCETRDRNALIAFYNALDGPNWVNNTNWNTAAPLNTWYGVTTNASGCVIGIDFISTNSPGGNGLYGTLPNEIGDLVDLQRLDLVNHNIYGVIPDAIGNLVNLEFLDLRNNQLSGDLPGSMGNLTKLESLLLTSNQFTGSIPDSLENLSELEVFLASENQFSGTLPEFLGSLTNLRQLWLGNNQFKGSIPTSYFNLSNLEGLLLSFNQLSGTLPDLWGGLVNLTGLGLNNNNLTGQIPSSMSQLGNLYNLNLSDNQFTGNVPPSFQNLTDLGAFYIANNQLEGRIPNLTGLPILDFRFQGNSFQFGDFENEFNYYSNNLSYFLDNPQSKLGLEETRVIAEGGSTTLSVSSSGSANSYQWFKDGVPLTNGGGVSGSTTDTLTLSNALASDDGVYHCEVQSSIVTDLVLLSNDITVQILTGPCEPRDRAALIALYNALDGPNWINNTNWNTAAPLNTWYGVTTDSNGCVIEIDLNPTNTAGGNNGLTGTLPDELGYLLNLQFLDLTHQNIMGPIPNTLGNLRELRWLEMDNNQLTGPIPGTFGYLTNMEFLSIRSNQLTGPLPDEIGNMSALGYLILDGNQISGEIPVSIGNLSNLEIVWLFENEFTGAIPSSIQNLGQLSQLLLNDNQLSGEIPDIWTSLPNMVGIWLDNNMLTGEIPPSIFQLSQLEQLALQDNQLSGIISSDFQYLTSLVSLYVGNNNFTGEIPAELGTISTLENLGIYQTQISGEIPPELGLLSNLRILWLLENNLTGTLPESLTGLYNLQQLHVGDNQLNGTVPADLNQLSNLESLGINNNLFDGPIPDFSQTSLDVFVFENNRFQFGDFEAQFDNYANNLSIFVDNPQAKIDEIKTINGNIGENVTLTTTASGSQNHYQWFKNGVPIPNAPDSPILTISNLRDSDQGVYYVEVTSDIVIDLTLIRHDITLIVGCQIQKADVFEDVVACGGFVLPLLSSGNAYYTESNGMGIELLPGQEIDQSQMVYIYKGQEGCFDQTNFLIIIVEEVIVDFLSDVFECENYELPELVYGNYFSEPSGQGTPYFPGDIINTSRTIYIYQDNGICSDESYFTIYMDKELCEEPEEELVLFPKFFTPNNDGTNDVWKMNPQEDYVIVGYIYIYDRYGKLLKQMDALTGYWDGTYNGREMPASSYWFRFENSEDEETQNGYFALVR
ncbi:leucine-rich repeat domain-containing protein [Flagellimonas lutimaris]|uniref:leucine-rich repeat domain-containing protein n=1 Tax=Flagellimonas lutimaris TaxID=475082 RepID=UPI003F5CCE53